MDILFVTTQEVSQVDTVPAALPTQGFLWLDIVRDGDSDWPKIVEQLTGVSVHERHIKDTRNLAHPSFYDGT